MPFEAIDIFNDYYWHDSVLESIVIDRSNPGNVDQVELIVSREGTKTKLTFVDCYYVSCSFNMGIIAEESILSAECSAEHSLLDGIRKKWQPLDPLQGLYHFYINTNSTNSDIVVCSKGVRFESID